MLKRKIREFLLDSGAITEHQLNEAIENSNGDEVEQKLVDLGYISETEIAKNLAKQLNLNYVDLGNHDINPQISSLLSSEQIYRYNALPIDIDGDRLVVAMADPTDVLAIDDLRVMVGYEIVPVVVTADDFHNAVNKYCISDDIVEEAIESVSEDLSGKSTASGLEALDSEEAPIIKLVNMIITEAVRDRASDIFIEPQEKDVRVRYRIDGVIQEVMHSPKQIQTGIISRVKVMAGLNIVERRLPQDGRFGMLVDRKPIDFRVATLPAIYGEHIVLRILKKESVSMKLDDLGFLPDDLEHFKESFSKPYGAILITGPTGSGKTTTLYGVLNVINTKERNLLTVEDPVEYRLPGVNQIQVNTKIGLTFARALRSFLRHDPDVIMVGEIRDEETALIAIESALTGHLVLSTLHTNNAPSALTRLIEMGVEPFLVTSAVDCIVAQRLTRRLCDRCREEFKPTKEELEEAGYRIDGTEPDILYRSRGCKLCMHTGYQGRIGIYEIMMISESIERLLIDRATTEEVAKAALAEGMKTLRQDGLEKVRMGLTSIEEVVRVTM
ncbi:MAG: Flp pilus assembly complex ATPase component TadA [Actinobacteria bacterium]|nr:Flp pilus assembly complex ATPase component TadA [Actinomycetota bacterium]